MTAEYRSKPSRHQRRIGSGDRSRRGAGLITWLLALSMMAPLAASASTFVRVSTTFGDFSIELFDEQTPVTVDNFLNYVDRGAYDGTFFHRLERDQEQDLVLQGGGFEFVPFEGPVAIETDPPIPNEPALSNTRGTLAMAKQSGDPDSATSQWFINLSDNSDSLDEQSGGFTVFGEVLGDGMEVVDRIAEQQVCNLGGFATTIPMRSNFECGQNAFPVDENFIQLAMHQTVRFSSDMHVYEDATGTLFTTVDAGEEGLLSVRMSVVTSTAERMVLKVDEEAMIPLAIEPEGVATYSGEDKRLRIPRLEVNDDGEIFEATDVVLRLSDAQRLRFTLESFNDPR